ncbi:MAG TPA: hypothetical protein VFD71_02925 [Planctomycetota bacterium]|jgi:CHASE2 domain-containing sensor protein|nr:hypothetical protein [Planctomycetota bacterium]
MNVLSTMAAAIASCLLSYALQGELGLQGSLVGLGVAAVLCGITGALMAWARRSSGQALLAAMLASVFLSFILMAVAMVAISRLWREILPAASLTSLAVYLVYRLTDSFHAPPNSKPHSGPEVTA